MKLSYPASTFNAHTHFFARSEKLLHEKMQKYTKNHKEFV